MPFLQNQSDFPGGVPRDQTPRGFGVCAMAADSWDVGKRVEPFERLFWVGFGFGSFSDGEV